MSGAGSGRPPRRSAADEEEQLTGEEEVLADLGELAPIGEDDDGGSSDGGGMGGDEFAEEHVEEIDLGEDEQVGGYEVARRKEPLGPDNARATFAGHTDSVYAVAASPAGPRAASGGGDDVAFLWDTATGAQVACLRGHTDSVVAVAFSHDGRLVATGSYDATVRVWDAATGEALHTLDGPSGEVEWVAFHPRGAVVLAGCGDGTAWMWDVTRRAPGGAACMQVFAGHEDGVTCGGFDPAGKAVVTGCSDAGVRVFNPKTAACTSVFRADAPVNAVAFHPAADKPLLAIGGQDGVASVINLTTQKVIARLQHAGEAKPAAAAGRRAGAGGGDDAASVASSVRGRGGPMDQDDEGGEGQGQEEEEEEEVGRSVESVSFCASHSFVASGATDGSVIVHDLSAGAVRHVLLHDEAVTRVAFLPNSPLLAVATADGLLAVYDTRSGSRQLAGTGHRGMIIDLAVAPGGKGVITAGDDGTCRVFEM